MRAKILIWQIRTERGISLLELEKLTGIGHSTLNRIENEKTSPTLDRLIIIAEALEVNVKDLFETR
jgi:transcriptional regulator with XRE-family HTH domain